jgi:guanylate kinase
LSKGKKAQDSKRPARSKADKSPAITRRGLLLVLSSPSGAGKTTLARRLLAADDNIHMSVSVTTRAPRPGEVDGQDYHFIDQTRFDAMMKRGDLLEGATVFGRSYGTPRAPVEAALSKGRDVLFDIDWQGTQQLAEKLPHDLVRVFILPPDGPTLEARLKARAQDSADEVARRMAKAAGEISHWAEYDYIIVNRDLDESERGLRAILAAERLKRDRQRGLAAFVDGIVTRL